MIHMCNDRHDTTELFRRELHHFDYFEISNNPKKCIPVNAKVMQLLLGNDQIIQLISAKKLTMNKIIKMLHELFFS